jgi:hypothetical protein
MYLTEMEFYILRPRTKEPQPTSKIFNLKEKYILAKLREWKVKGLDCISGSGSGQVEKK